MKYKTSRRTFLLQSAASGLCASILPKTAAANLFLSEPGWRFCGSCNVLFHEASGTGVCAGNPSGHTAIGLEFTIIFTDDTCVPDEPRFQSRWRKCADCQTMYFNGTGSIEICPAGGQHTADRDKCYLLPINRTHAEALNPANSHNQGGWRFCGRCGGMFFDGFLDNKGRCPAGGAHAALGDFFVLTHFG